MQRLACSIRFWWGLRAVCAGGAAVLGVGSAGAQITVTTISTNGLHEPFHLAAGPERTVLVADAGDHLILSWDGASGQVRIVAGQPDGEPGANDGPSWEARFFNPQGVLWIRRQGEWGVLVSDSGNHALRFVRASDGWVTTVAGRAGEPGGEDGVGPASRLHTPVGLGQAPDGSVYVADSGNHRIRRYNPDTDELATVTLEGASLRGPTAVAFDDQGRLWVADTMNHQVKAFDLTNPREGRLWTVLGDGRPGYRDSVFGASARFQGPRGLLWWPDLQRLVIADANNHVIRQVQPQAQYGETNFAVATLAGTPQENGFVDGAAGQGRFDTPVGLALDPDTETLLVADLKNHALRRVQLGPALPPVAPPQIGWVDFVYDPVVGAEVTVLRTDDQPRIFNNDVYFAIKAERGAQVHYTVARGPWPPGLIDYGQTPTRDVGATAPEYRDGMLRDEFLTILPVLEIPEAGPPSETNNQAGLVIKAVAFAAGRAVSEVVTARYGFKVGTPMILGQNPASFRVENVTVQPQAQMRYTTDGSVPTEESELVPSSGRLQLSMPEGATQLVFRVRGFARGYAPSDIAEKVFTLDGYMPTRIALGFPSGEASSQFVAAPGQTFYAPVVLSLADETIMYSLQFQLTVTNVNGPPVGGVMDFVSMLYEQVAPEDGEKAPPGQGSWYRVIPPAAWSPTPTNRVFYRQSDPFTPLMDLRVFEPERGLMMVGWLERWLFGNLYNTRNQDLISFSIARDNLFEKSQGRVVLGAAAFQIPIEAAADARYELRVDRPSATSDGVGAPGSQVPIAVPLTGHLTNGGFLGVRTVSMGTKTYVAGDVAPFRWLNAGDFGDGKLLNDDVMQIFQTALYNFSPINPATGQPYDPPYHSDFRDAMDVGPVLGAPVNGTDYWLPATNLADPEILFEAGDELIDRVAFGDGVINVVDVFIAFRRSLDPARVWFERFWTNGVRAARPIAQAEFGGGIRAASGPRENPPPVWPNREPLAWFQAEDRVVVPGAIVEVPVRVRVEGRWPARVLMFSLAVRPLEGAQALEEPVEFIPTASWGAPTVVSRPAINMVAVAWLDPNRPGESGESLLGTLRLRIPSQAATGAVYRVDWGHASASPTGLAALPATRTCGLLVVGDRSSSSVGDGIPDSWRLRYFDSVHAVLGAAEADADGDGLDNRSEYLAGTDPTDVESVLRVRSGRSQGGITLRWPARAGVRYSIECASSPLGEWVPIGEVVADGPRAQFTDNMPDGGPRFYRVKAQR